MRLLKQSTSVDLPIGPFVDETDFKTPETALTITQPDIRLKKNGGAWAQKAAAQTLSHEENGNYEVTLDATDTDTLGLLRLHVSESGALPVWEDFMVVPANIWDSWFGADKQQVDAVEISGDPTAADNAEAFFDGTGYAGTGNVIPTVTTLTGHTAQTGDSFARLGAPAGVSVSADIAAAKAQTAAIETDTQDIQSRLPAALAGGRMSSTSILEADAVDAAALKADAVTEIITAIFAKTIDGVTFNQMIAIFAAALAGKASGMNTTTAVLRNLADSLDRITATVDANGNRTAVTLDLTGV
jgi:hypothetical protein